MSLISNGWKLLFFADFLTYYTTLRAEAGRRLESGQENHPKVKFLRRLNTILFEEVPQDPTDSKYMLGNTMGPEARHWRRVKFNQRFRLFFWFSNEHKTIVFSYLNDEASLRKAGSRTDPYGIFKRLLAKGRPPNKWEDLMIMAKKSEDE